MPAFRAVVRQLVRAALPAAVLVSVVHAEDDVVRKAEPVPPPAQAPVFGGQIQGGRVIIMPGLRLQVGGQGQLQAQGNVREPAANAAPAGEVRKEAYLGVVAGVVAPPVRAQLELPEGVGLSIDAIAAGGPAEKAGVKQFDVIHKFNDQVVCSPEQLTTLVKVAGAGTKVPLTLVRGGREQVVEAVLEERAVAVDEAGEAFVQAMPGVLNLQQMIPPGVPGGLGPQVQADIERKLAEALARAGAGGVLPGFPPGLAPGVIPPMPVMPQGGPGHLRAQVLTIGPNAQSATAVSDARGTVEIRSADGKKTVIVKDPTGKEVHAGPLDTDDDLERVPEDYRDWVREVDAGQPVIPRLAPEADELESESAPAGDEADAGGPTI